MHTHVLTRTDGMQGSTWSAKVVQTAQPTRQYSPQGSTAVRARLVLTQHYMAGTKSSRDASTDIEQRPQDFIHQPHDVYQRPSKAYTHRGASGPQDPEVPHPWHCQQPHQAAAGPVTMSSRQPPGLCLPPSVEEVAMEGADLEAPATPDAHHSLPGCGPCQVVHHLLAHLGPIPGRMEARVVIHLGGGGSSTAQSGCQHTTQGQNQAAHGTKNVPLAE